MANLTREEQAALATVVAVGEAIKALGRIPSGELYVQLMSRMSLEVYNKVIAMLTKVGAIKVENHEIIWIGG
jgi:hypothetical protein